ncbi:MAG: hypothetical protein GY703_21635 [Gammaproteobacteria bacterium]|nr:hypothetical protein [Gammaproteobacteria bacterium]
MNRSIHITLKRLTWLSMGLCAILTRTLSAEVHDTTIADVTPRAFSVVWVSDVPVIDAYVRVFTDAEGRNEITDILDIKVKSLNVGTAHQSGIVKVDVQGIAPDSAYYVQTETVSNLGLVRHPLEPPNIGVITAMANTSVGGDDRHIASNLLVRNTWETEFETPIRGALVLVRVPELSRYPVTAFVDEIAGLPTVTVDLNNIVNDTTGTNEVISADVMVEIELFRGLRCDDVAHQRLVQRRRLPDPDGTSPGPAAADTEGCFAPNGHAADFNCDARIGAADLNLLLSQLNSADATETSDCHYNLDFDLDEDGNVGAGDLNLLLTLLGTSE